MGAAVKAVGAAACGEAVRAGFGKRELKLRAEAAGGARSRAVD